MGEDVKAAGRILRERVEVCIRYFENIDLDFAQRCWNEHSRRSTGPAGTGHEHLQLTRLPGTTAVDRVEIARRAMRAGHPADDGEASDDNNGLARAGLRFGNGMDQGGHRCARKVHDRATRHAGVLEVDSTGRGPRGRGPGPAPDPTPRTAGRPAAKSHPGRPCGGKRTRAARRAVWRPDRRGYAPCPIISQPVSEPVGLARKSRGGCLRALRSALHTRRRHVCR